MVEAVGLELFVRLPCVLEGTNAELIRIRGMNCEHDILSRRG